MPQKLYTWEEECFVDINILFKREYSDFALEGDTVLLLTLFLKFVQSGVPHKVGQFLLLCHKLLHNRWKGQKKCDR